MPVSFAYAGFNSMYASHVLNNRLVINSTLVDVCVRLGIQTTHGAFGRESIHEYVCVVKLGGVGISAPL